jgi:hypothetical protein
LACSRPRFCFAFTVPFLSDLEQKANFSKNVEAPASSRLDHRWRFLFDSSCFAAAQRGGKSRFLEGIGSTGVESGTRIDNIDVHFLRVCRRGG